MKMRPVNDFPTVRGRMFSQQDTGIKKKKKTKRISLMKNLNVRGKDRESQLSIKTHAETGKQQAEESIWP